jgi:hypothetical protein
VKFPILYAEQEWRQNRMLVLILGALGVGTAGYYLLLRHGEAVNGLYGVSYLAMAGLLGGFYFLRRRRSYVEPGESGLKVGGLFKSQLIAYDHIRTARVLPLRQVIPDTGPGGKKRYLAPPVKAHLDSPSLVLRFKGEPEEIAAVTRGLGPRHMFDGTAVFPVPNPESAAKEIARHLPEGTGANLGGARRRGRRRR